MAQTKRKRKRKHRGTPAGTVERPARSGRPQSRDDAKKLAKQKRLERMDREPTWRGAVNRAAIAAVVLGVFAMLLLKRNAAQGVTLAVFMFVLYIPLGYATDSALHRYRQRKRG
jgi:Flp pilus assembly protein TadB